jgi:hypothetical protein
MSNFYQFWLFLDVFWTASVMESDAWHGMARRFRFHRASV